MALYYTIFFILAFFVFLEGINLDRRITGYIYWVFCVFFFILSFIRWETGTDWYNYFTYFETVEDIDFGEDTYEFGFSFLNRFVRLISDNYTVVLLLSGAILFSFQSVSIKRMSPYPLLSLLFLWSTQFANVLFVRQWIAVVILFFSTKYIEKKNFLFFILFVLLAYSFHRSSLLFLIAYWIYHLDLTRKRMIIILGISIVFSLALTKVMEFIANNVGGIVQAKLDLYLNDEYNSEVNEELNIVGVMIRGFANKLLILLFSFYFYVNIIKTYPNFKGYLNLYWFGSIIYFCLLPISIVLVRMSYIFDFFQIILAAFIFTQIKTTPARLLFLLIFFFYLFLRLNQIVNGPYMEEYVPFKIFID